MTGYKDRRFAGLLGLKLRGLTACFGLKLGWRPEPRRSVAQRAAGAYNSVYLADRPLAFSTGYLAALAAIFDSIAAATSMPVMLANSSA
jgi:hypothetical protein